LLLQKQDFFCGLLREGYYVVGLFANYARAGSGCAALIAANAQKRFGVWDGLAVRNESKRSANVACSDDRGIVVST